MTISQSSFTFVSDLVRRETAMLYDPGKEYLIEARLLPLAREAGCADVDTYVVKLQSDFGERAKVLDALTINETSWFRDNAPYQAFTDVMLPAMIAARAHVRHISIWSAACSSGQEAYSLAMLLDQHLPPGWTAQILATDVSPKMLARVDAGRYSQVEMNRGLPATSLVKYFSRAGSEWEVCDDLKKMVRTQPLNLSTPFPVLPTFDIVFIRNVLIYFDMEMKRDILRKVHQVISHDGFMLLGSSETTLDMDDHWGRQAHGRVQIHRPAGSPALASTASTSTFTTTAMTGA